MSEKDFIQQIVESFKTLSLTSGKNKEPDDFTILHEYLTRYGKKPSMLRLSNGTTEYFILNMLLKELEKTFNDFEIIYRDQTYSYRYNKMINSRIIIKITEGYLCEIGNEFIDNVMDEEHYIEVGLNQNDELVTDIRVLVPSITNKKIIDSIVKIFKQCNVDCKNKKIAIDMLAMDRGELYTESFYLNDNIVDLVLPDLHYGKGFENFHTKLIEKLRKDTKGLVLLHGVPGTGKTFYIRQLLKELTKEDANILYFSPLMVGSITDPSFINFISNWATENEDRKGILLIEDAEPLLETREDGRNIGITNLLNLTDGLLNDILKIQIIATFNTKLKNIDEALLRPERLIARKEFKKLSKSDIYKLIEKIDIKKETIDDFLVKNKTDEMSLAEIYSLKRNNEIIEHDIKKTEAKIGFKKSE